MDHLLFNVLERLRHIRDYIVQSGPSTLRSAGDVFAMISGYCQNVADYVEAVGPMVQFAPGDTNIGGDRAKEYLNEIVAIKGEIEAELAKSTEAGESLKAEHQKQMDNKVQAGLLDWASKVDPGTKSEIASVVLSFLAKLLVKSSMFAFAAPKGGHGAPAAKSKAK
jgi:hypothetical protein